MRKLGIFVLVMLGLISCQNVERTEKPKDLIAEDKMVDILVELSLLQGAKSTNRSLFEQKGIYPDEYLWERFDIDSMQFVNSNNYYSRNYREYENIYVLVQERLEGLRAEYDSLREIADERERDSLKVQTPEDSLAAERERTYRDSIIRISSDGDSLVVRRPAELQRDTTR